MSETIMGRVTKGPIPDHIDHVDGGSLPEAEASLQFRIILMQKGEIKDPR
jgi:hypothetical protein